MRDMEMAAAMVGECLDAFGLKGFKVYLDRQPQLPDSYSVCLVKSVDHRMETSREFAEQFVHPLAKSLSESEGVQALRKEDREKIDKLERRVAELTPYETHYQVEMRLRHGKAGN